jgi:hypothetical protein
MLAPGSWISPFRRALFPEENNGQTADILNPFDGERERLASFARAGYTLLKMA